MARARNIKPGFFTNDELVEHPFAVRLLFIGLWTIADREGRLIDRPKKIRMEIFPGDDVDCDDALQKLADSGFIKRYAVNGERFIQVVNWGKHQNPHVKEQASIIPAPDMHQTCTVQTPDLHGSCPADSLFSDSLNLIPDTRGKTTPSPDHPRNAKPKIAAVGGLTCVGQNRFDDFWKAYPKKTGKEDARRVWAKLKITPTTTHSILKALAWQVETDQWRRDGGQYIPNPSTYLNQGRWQDEPPSTQTNGLTPVGRKSAEATNRWLESQEDLHEKRG